MNKKDLKKVAMGKKSKAAGKAFEDRGYLDLEKKGWIVSRWMKNVEFEKEITGFSVCPGKDKHTTIKIDGKETNSHFETDFIKKGKLVAVKPKIRMIPGIGPVLVSMWNGFPDFIVFRTSGMPIHSDCSLGETNLWTKGYENLGVEFKMDGRLDKLEKAKCKWLLENNIFSRILIAKKGKKRGEIVYKEFKNG